MIRFTHIDYSTRKGVFKGSFWCGFFAALLFPLVGWLFPSMLDNCRYSDSQKNCLQGKGHWLGCGFAIGTWWGTNLCNSYDY